MTQPGTAAHGEGPRPLLCYFPAPPRFTGAPRSVFNFMRAMDPARFRPVFVSQEPSPLSEQVQAAGIETVIIPFPPLLSRPRPQVVRQGLAGQLRTARAVARYGREVEAVARRVGSCGFWVRGMDGALLIAGAARRLGQPLLLDVAAEPERFGLFHLGYGYAAWRAALMVVQDTRQFALTLGPVAARALRRRMVVLPPGITAERVREALAVPRPDGSGTFTLLCPGTIHPRKNQMMLLRAVARLVERHPVRVRLAGIVADAEYDARLRAFARERLPDGAVEFMGWRDDAPLLMRQADLVVLCSRSEGIPHVLREAMHVETPVVATAVGGMPDLVIDGETGFLVPGEDPGPLAEAIERCIRDPDGLRRVAVRARRRVESNYSYSAWTERYNQLLREVFG